MATPIHADLVEGGSYNGFPEPFYSRLGPYVGRELGDAFKLQQFGVSLETLPPGSQSALRHWHTKNDEFVWMVAGELTLVTNDGETVLRPGMCVGFVAGAEDGLHLINRSASDAAFLVVGGRRQDDAVVYPDDDIAWVATESGYAAAHKDGTPY